MSIFDAPWWQQFAEVLSGVIMGWLAKLLHIKGTR